MSAAIDGKAGRPLRLGIRANVAQFALLVVVNAFVGAMVGMERSILPLVAEDEFRIDGRTAILSFIAAFGLTKAISNYAAGRWSDRHGRKPVLVAGWIVAAPVPLILMYAPTWGWMVAANLLLGVSQGMTWSTTVIMKIDLAGPSRRGLAMGVNECAGYAAVALAALASGYVAATYGLRPAPFAMGIAFVAIGTALSVFAVRETRHHVDHESRTGPHRGEPPIAQREVFLRTTVTDRNLSAVTQAGLVNNLNDGMAWGLFPLLFASSGLTLVQVGTLAAIYPATWGIAQLATGAWSDRVGRKGPIVWGMWVQAAGIAVVAAGDGFGVFATGAALLGIGTAMVYPTFLAAIGDVARPSWRASAVGVFRLWRDLGYAVGALVSGAFADWIGLRGAALVVAGLTFASGLLVSVRMRPGSPRGPQRRASAHESDEARIRS